MFTKKETYLNWENTRPISVVKHIQSSITKEDPQYVFGVRLLSSEYRAIFDAIGWDIRTGEIVCSHKNLSMEKPFADPEHVHYRINEEDELSMKKPRLYIMNTIIPNSIKVSPFLRHIVDRPRQLLAKENEIKKINQLLETGYRGNVAGTFIKNRNLVKVHAVFQRPQKPKIDKYKQEMKERKNESRQKYGI